MTPRNAWRIGVQQPPKKREISEAEREFMRQYAEAIIEKFEQERLERLLWPRRYR